MAYTTGFKSAMVRRLTGPNATSASALSKEVGIKQPTLSRWRREAEKVAEAAKSDKVTAMKSLGRRQWTPARKLRVLAESLRAEGPALGELLRREGLQSVDIERWRAIAESALDGRHESAAEKQLRERAEVAEKALARNEKALAETAALLVLRGKAVALWGAADDDTESTSARLRRRSLTKP